MGRGIHIGTGWLAIHRAYVDTDHWDCAFAPTCHADLVAKAVRACNTSVSRHGRNQNSIFGRWINATRWSTRRRRSRREVCGSESGSRTKRRPDRRPRTSRALTFTRAKGRSAARCVLGIREETPRRKRIRCAGQLPPQGVATTTTGWTAGGVDERTVRCYLPGDQSQCYWAISYEPMICRLTSTHPMRGIFPASVPIKVGLSEPARTSGIHGRLLLADNRFEWISNRCCTMTTIRVEQGRNYVNLRGMSRETD